MLRIDCMFAEIDKWGKLKFAFLDMEDREKLMNISKGIPPFDFTEFTVSHPIKGLLDNWVGRRVRVWIKPRQYSFKSTREINKGEIITGTALDLCDIVAL